MGFMIIGKKSKVLYGIAKMTLSSDHSIDLISIVFGDFVKTWQK